MKIVPRYDMVSGGRFQLYRLSQVAGRTMTPPATYDL
jgi:hypothetical protein